MEIACLFSSLIAIMLGLTQTLVECEKNKRTMVMGWWPDTAATTEQTLAILPSYPLFDYIIHFTIC